MSTATPAAPPDATPLREREVDRLIHRIGVMAAGLVGELDIGVEPGQRWMADLRNRIIYYDLGLASQLSKLAQRGVIAHEVGHLRHTKEPRYPKALSKVDRDWAHRLFNVFEDRRMELLMADEFPGFAPAFAKLRATFAKRDVKEVLGKAPPAFQFITGLYSVIFEQTPYVTHPDVIDALDHFKDEALDAAKAPTSGKMVKALIGSPGVRAGSIFERLIEFRDMPEEDQKLRANDLDPPEPEPDPEPEPQPEPDEADADEGDPASGPDAAGAGQDPDANISEVDDAEADGDEERPLGPGAPPLGGDEDLVEREDAGDGGEPPSAVGGEAGGESGDPTEAPDPSTSGDAALDEDLDPDQPGEDDWRALPGDMADMLDDALDEAIGSSSLDKREQDLAQRLRGGMDDAQGGVDNARRSVRDLMRGRGQTEDDKRFNMPCDNDDYDLEVFPQIDMRASRMGRDLDSILVENRTDRWSVIGYPTGPKVHTRRLARIGVGANDVFRQRTVRKNRNFAVSVLCDISGSMYGGRIEHAVVATSLLAESFEFVQGAELALYVFGAQSICIKPFDRPWLERRGRMGVLRDSDNIEDELGYNTCLGAAMVRAGRELTERYGGPKWNRMMLVITDGQPNNCEREECKAAADVGGIRGELERKHNIECLGVGIQTQGQLATLFNHWTTIDNPAALPKALTRLIRHRVRKA